MLRPPPPSDAGRRLSDVRPCTGEASRYRPTFPSAHAQQGRIVKDLGAVSRLPSRDRVGGGSVLASTPRRAHTDIWPQKPLRASSPVKPSTPATSRARHWWSGADVVIAWTVVQRSGGRGGIWPLGACAPPGLSVALAGRPVWSVSGAGAALASCAAWAVLAGWAGLPGARSHRWRRWSRMPGAGRRRSSRGRGRCRRTVRHLVLRARRRAGRATATRGPVHRSAGGRCSAACSTSATGSHR